MYSLYLCFFNEISFKILLQQRENIKISKKDCRHNFFVMSILAIEAKTRGCPWETPCFFWQNIHIRRYIHHFDFFLGEMSLKILLQQREKIEKLQKDCMYHFLGITILAQKRKCEVSYEPTLSQLAHKQHTHKRRIYS